MATINIDYIAKLNILFNNGETRDLQNAINEIERIRVIASAFNAATITSERNRNIIRSYWAAIDQASKEYVAIGNEIISNRNGKYIDLFKVDQLFKTSDKVFGAWKSLIEYLHQEHLDDEDSNICFSICEAIYNVAGRSSAEDRVYCLLKAFVLHDDSLDI